MIFTFDILNKWDYSIPMPANTRTKEVLERYNIFKKELVESNITINDYVLHKYLKSKQYSLDLNTFPYNIPNNMKHYVLWIHPNYKKLLTNKKLSDILTTNMQKLGYNEYICFENHIACKTVLGILHYQVFFHTC
jgi:hypothetical protein